MLSSRNANRIFQNSDAARLSLAFSARVFDLSFRGRIRTVPIAGTDTRALYAKLAELPHRAILPSRSCAPHPPTLEDLDGALREHRYPLARPIPSRSRQ